MVENLPFIWRNNIISLTLIFENWFIFKFWVANISLQDKILCDQLIFIVEVCKLVQLSLFLNFELVLKIIWNFNIFTFQTIKNWSFCIFID